MIAKYGPEPSADERGTIIVGAHYDVFEEPPGADDNASGVAGLIELGRMLATAQLGAPVTLVAFATEEPPFFRSDATGSADHSGREGD